MVGLRGFLAAVCWFVILSTQAAYSSEDDATPLVIGETFTIDSKTLAETRRINVYLPSAYKASPDVRLPVLYLLDGGMAEDFLHVAGLMQVCSGNGTMKGFLLVGIENTERRRDLTGPTDNLADKKIAPRVGGSELFRKFLRDELIPLVNQRYRTTRETAIMGESLAGLFVVETFLLEPDLFDTYIAIDPSLWWNDRKLVAAAGTQLRTKYATAKTLFVASSQEKKIEEEAQRLADAIAKVRPENLTASFEKMPDEQHATIFHPAALKAFRKGLKPIAAK